MSRCHHDLAYLHLTHLIRELVWALEADRGGRAVYGVGLRPLDWWNRGFKSRWGHWCPSLVFVMCCVGSYLCNELITRSEESYRVCVCVCLIVCDLETSTMRRRRPELSWCATEKGKKQVWLCRGHGRVFYVNTCTLTGNIFFQRIICMS
jgi:hypothetical protein